MFYKKNIVSFLLMILISSGCSKNVIAPNIDIPKRGSGLSDLVVPGDIIEINFYRGTEVITSPYIIAEGDKLRVDILKSRGSNSPFLISEGDILRVDIAEAMVTSMPFNISEGNVLNVDVFEHPELSRSDVLVLPDGYISLPLANRIKASGKRLDELAKKLEKIYKKNKISDPNVTVSIIERKDYSSELSRLRVLVLPDGYISMPFVNLLPAAGKTIKELKQDLLDIYSRMNIQNPNVTVSIVESNDYSSDLSRPQVLALPDGYISLPLVNRIEAVGKNIEELEKILTEAYKEKGVNNISITVSINETHNRLDSLLPLTSDTAKKSSLVVRVDEFGFIDLPYIPLIKTMRSFEEIQREIVKAYEEKFANRLEVTVNLRERQSHFVHVIGEVVFPGNVKFTRPFNPLLAIASAGGFLPTANPSKVRLYRFKNNGDLDYWPIDLEQKLNDLNQLGGLMEAIPQDIIFVPKSGIAIANQVIDQYIRKMIPVGVGFGLGFPLK